MDKYQPETKQRLANSGASGDEILLQSESTLVSGVWECSRCVADRNTFNN
jgi:hypothetical protein